MKSVKVLFGGMVLVILCICGCKSPSPPVTDVLYRQIGQETFSRFRFHISKDVDLTKVDTNISTDAKATVVKSNVRRDIIHLKASTTGRVQGVSTEERLEIGFERMSDGTIPTFIFVQKKGDGLYYFEQNSSGYVEYGGDYYTVSYKNSNEEPYLLYILDETEKTKTRKMGGLK